MRLGDIWGSLRGLVRDTFSFAQIKDVVGASGLPIHTLAHLQQKFSGGASKGQLLDAIDGLVAALDADARDRFVAACITEVLRRDNRVQPVLEELLRRVGWALHGDEPYPLRLNIDLATTTTPLPAAVNTAIDTAIRRYRDGDMDGAMTAICGAVDALTLDVYQQTGLGDPHTAAFHERVSRSFGTVEQRYRQDFSNAGMPAADVNLLWNNQRQSIAQAGYVLESLRRQFSDAHGVISNVPAAAVQRALHSAVYIIRALSD
jgi:hypothetical protein